MRKKLNLIAISFLLLSQCTVVSSQTQSHNYVLSRTMLNGDGTIKQVTHYYPFGGIISDLSLNADLQQYKYNGKELDLAHGLRRTKCIYSCQNYFSTDSRF